MHRPAGRGATITKMEMVCCSERGRVAKQDSVSSARLSFFLFFLAFLPSLRSAEAEKLRLTVAFTAISHEKFASGLVIGHLKKIDSVRPQLLFRTEQEIKKEREI